MVRRKGDSHRRIVARQNYNQRRQHSSQISQLANYVSLVPVPTRPGSSYGDALNERLTRGLRTFQRHIKDWYRRRKYSQQIERQALADQEEYGTQDAADNVDPADVYGGTSTNKSMGKSRYLGNFKRPHPYSDNWETKCLKNGYVWIEELYGKVSDPNSIYMTHSTFNSALLAQVITMTWLRKVLKKAGIECKDRNAIIPLQNISVGTGGRFEYHEQHPTSGVITTTGYETVAGETMTSLLSNFGAMTTAIQTYLNGQSESLPFQLNFYSFDISIGPASKFNVSGVLDLDNEVLDVYANSEIKIQNRTSPDTATAGNQDVDRSDIQPLVGTLYEFNGDPKLKKMGTNNANLLKLQGVVATGIKLNRSAEFTDVTYNNRPPAQIFLNCYKRSNVVLQPGEVKRGNVYFNYKGTVKSLLPKAAIETNTASLCYSVKCKTQMLVFEELMRTAGTNEIVVQYERKHRVGCMSYTKKPTVPFLPALTSAPVNLP